MSQYMSQVISQTMRQEQRLTPQLIQSMDILQLPLMALQQRINQELQENPVLEYELETPEPEGQADEDKNGEQTETPGDPLDDLEVLAESLYYEPGRWSRGRASNDGEDDPKLQAMANTAAPPESLHEYLMHQWSFVEADPEVKRAGEAIINFIEDDGYLRTNFETIAESVKPPLEKETLSEALKLVQRLDPPGVGARDLQECLLLQLEAAHADAELAKRIVRDHLMDLAKKRLPAIAKATGASLDEVKEAVELISRLNARPGLTVVDRPVARIVPDIIVEYDEEEDEYRVSLVRGNAPRLRLSPTYIEMYRRSRSDPKVRDFLRKKIEAARAIRDAVEYRRERLLQVAKAVVERQREFFDRGPEYLKVLRMCDLAAEFGCDPSTISRTVDGKYMQTPRGIFPLRYFFTGGTETDQGESMSWDAVKARVRQIVETEDKSNPLSDDQIAKILRKEGINISRRTVAKYRAQLNIPAARQRKVY